MAKDKPLPQAGPELAEYTTAAQPKAYADGVPVFCALRLSRSAYCSMSLFRHWMSM